MINTFIGINRKLNFIEIIEIIVIQSTKFSTFNKEIFMKYISCC